MRIFCEDRKLNISPYYLRPGFAFGGSCLPKDLRATVYAAQQHDVEVPILRATLESNRMQIERAFDMVVATGHKRVGILGLSFKAGTDDLRESPMVTLIERLIGKGLDLRIYDRGVVASQLLGANKDYIEREIPHIWSMMAGTLEDVLAHAGVLVIGNRAPEFSALGRLLREDQVVVDLVRVFEPGTPVRARVTGISW
jgi:GDP-mannose 6-dehydrogenase